MVKEKKYSLYFQQKEVRLVGKARKAIRISSIKEVSLGRKERKYGLDFLHKDVS